MEKLVRRPPRVAPDGQSWRFIHFDARRLATGETLAGDSGDNETALIVLGGRARVEASGREFRIDERQDVWERRPPGLVLLPPGCPYHVRSESNVELVVVGAAAGDRTREARLIGPDDMLVERRGE